jgi:ketosteroid isomerase-like protein
MRKSLLALLSVTILTHFAGPALCDATDRAKGGNAVMPGADDVVKSMMERYTRAVNANDSAAYSKLFAADAIRVPPGSDPEYGPAQIAKSEQSDYDQARWSIKMTLIDALGLNEQWVYGLVPRRCLSLVLRGRKEGGKTRHEGLSPAKAAEWRLADKTVHLEPQALAFS